MIVRVQNLIVHFWKSQFQNPAKIQQPIRMQFYVQNWRKKIFINAIWDVTIASVPITVTHSLTKIWTIAHVVKNVLVGVHANAKNVGIVTWSAWNPLRTQIQWR